MFFRSLIESRYLQIFHYEDVDHFRHGLQDASVHIVPIANITSPLGQAVVDFPGCKVYLFRTFPRVVSAGLQGRCTVFMIPMTDAPAMIFSGTEVYPASMQYGRGPVEYRAFENALGLYAAVIFSGWLDERG